MLNSGGLGRTPAQRIILFFRAAFVLYIPVLFTATHWPKLEIPGEGRPDLLVHVLAFGLWTLLLIGSGLFGPALSWRNIALSFPVAALYAAFDEGTQAIPWVRRHPGIDDYLANLLGIVLACAGMALIMMIARALGITRRTGPKHTGASAADPAAPR